MEIIDNTPAGEPKQEWENPRDPESPLDARDDEQVERQIEEAKRRKENLTETDQPETE